MSTNRTSTLSSSIPHEKPTQTPPLQLNVLSVVLGAHIIKPRYPSFYHEELVGKEVVSRLYVCEKCFKYTKSIDHYVGHRRHCGIEQPPGDLIYEKGGYRIYKVDGEDHTLFVQSLSLFAKLFIETKSVCFDVKSFEYYVLTSASVPASERHVPRRGRNNTTGDNATGGIVGFFSKEKNSWDCNNLACILIFPPWQRRRLGQMLMGASYEISRREGRLGGPEKPLSRMGRHSYYSYWSRAIAQAVLQCRVATLVGIDDISMRTYIAPEDVVGTLLQMGVLGRTRRDGSVVVAKEAVREWLRETKTDVTVPIDPDGWLLLGATSGLALDDQGAEEAEDDPEAGAHEVNGR